MKPLETFSCRATGFDALLKPTSVDQMETRSFAAAAKYSPFGERLIALKTLPLSSEAKTLLSQFMAVLMILTSATSSASRREILKWRAYHSTLRARKYMD